MQATYKLHHLNGLLRGPRMPITWPNRKQLQSFWPILSFVVILANPIVWRHPSQRQTGRRPVWTLSRVQFMNDDRR